MHSEPATSHSPLATSSTADQEVLVKVEGVSKKFCRSLKKSLWYGLCDIGGELNPFRRQVAEVAGDELRVTSHNQGAEGGSILPATSYPLPVTPAAAARDEDLRDGEFYAVRDVSFELRRGECLGLIGHNGAGKTTLLKMLNGLIKPDAGRITMRGRVGALIALGAGFNPILTGRENIYINGSVLGLSKKEIDGKIDEIIDFSEIGEFIDSPVQNYSSGMSVRLGFAVATALNPDVLILDEVLAVGDASFRAKCYRRIGELQNNSAVIFVSHAMEHVGRICSEVMVMGRGKTVFLGEPKDGVLCYEKEMAGGGSDAGSFMKVQLPVLSAAVRLQNTSICWRESLSVELSVELTESLSNPVLLIAVYDSTGAIVASVEPTKHPFPSLPSGFSKVQVEIPSVTLAAGRYSIGLTIHPQSSISHLVWSYRELCFEVVGPRGAFAPCLLGAGEISVSCLRP